jgi:hypothetical protein
MNLAQGLRIAAFIAVSVSTVCAASVRAADSTRPLSQDTATAEKALPQIPLADAERLFPLAIQTLPDGSRRIDIQVLPVPLGLAIIDLTRRIDSLEAELKTLREKAQ